MSGQQFAVNLTQMLSGVIWFCVLQHSLANDCPPPISVYLKNDSQGRLRMKADNRVKSPSWLEESHLLLHNCSQGVEFSCS